MQTRFFVLNITVLIVLLSINIFSAASNSNIKGVVKDNQTNEPLIGTNVILTGTSLGGATDIDGNYVIKNVPPGVYTIRATYIGYKSKEFKIEIKEGINTVQDFNLEPESIEGQTVVITGQASGQLEAINKQLSADQIINSVSAARIQELPDANAAESIGRLPGISVLRSGGEADQVVIRGLAPKFNRILVNGVELTSSNPNDQSVDLSIISSNMLEGMDVMKTVTPDMDANVIGGTVNLELREAKVKEPGVPQFGLLAQGGYNGLSNAYNKFKNYKYVASAENRYFDNNFGIFVQGSVERRNLTSNQLGASYTHNADSKVDYLTNSLNLNNIPRDRLRYDGTLVLDYKFHDGSIKLSNFLGRGNTTVQNRGESYLTSSNTHNYTLTYSDSSSAIIINALHFQYQLPIFHLNAVFSHSYTESKDPNGWGVTFQQGSAGIGGFVGVANLRPEVLPSAANNDAGQTYLNAIQTFNSFSGARALSGSIDLETNLNFSDNISSVIKFGGMYKHELRKYLYTQTRGDGIGLLSAGFVDSLIAAQFPSTAKYIHTTSIPIEPYIDKSYDYGNFLGGDYPMVYALNYDMFSKLTGFLNNNISLIERRNAIAYSRDAFNSASHNYDGYEDLSAAYVMATIKLGSQITVLPGIRYQNLQTNYTGTQGQQTSASAQGGAYKHYDTTVTVNHGYWLPAVSLRYKPFSWFDIRLSYTNTLAYPDFISIIPRIDVPASTGGTIAWNNAHLKPTRSKNYDMYFSFYNNSIGLFTVGGFLKHIVDLIYGWTFHVSGAQTIPYYPQRAGFKPTQTPTGTYDVSTYINDSYRAVDYGFELDWQTHFWYLPQPFNGLVLNANYTHVYSKEEYPYVNTVKIGRTFIYDTTSFSDRLLYQPDNIANLSIGYDYEGFSIRVSMIYQDNIFSGPNFWPQLRTNTASYTRWDISAKQDLPWFGLQIYGDVSNLNGERDLDVIQAPTGVPQAEQDYGLIADFGIRLKL